VVPAQVSSQEFPSLPVEPSAGSTKRPLVEASALSPPSLVSSSPPFAEEVESEDDLASFDKELAAMMMSERLSVVDELEGGSFNFQEDDVLCIRSTWYIYSPLISYVRMMTWETRS